MGGGAAQRPGGRFGRRDPWGRLGLVVACALASAACRQPEVEPRGRDRAPSATPPAPPAVVRAEPSGAAPSSVATVDGARIDAADALRLLLLSAPDEANNAVRQLVLDRVAAAEAAALGIGVPAAVVERELERLLAEQERRVAEASKGKRDLAAHAKATWGIERAAYVALARATLERSLLLERVVLHELALHPRVQLRLLRVKERSLAEEIARKLELGADFAALARQHSEDGSAREGGLYPPLPSDVASPLFERTEGLAPGQCSPVHEVATPDGPRYRIVQLLARLPADGGDLAARSAAIEQLLDARALSPTELEAWMRLMEGRHEIRFHGLGSNG